MRDREAEVADTEKRVARRKNRWVGTAVISAVLIALASIGYYHYRYSLVHAELRLIIEDIFAFKKFQFNSAIIGKSKSGDKNIRGVIDDFISKEEADAIISLFADPSLKAENSTVEGIGPFEGLTLEEVSQISNETLKISLYDIRSKVLDTARKFFGIEDLWVEFTHLTKRGPSLIMSHGFHADNCKFPHGLSGPCVQLEDHCCSWRSHTAFLYLNEADGGNFCFLDLVNDDIEFTRVPPVAGRLVLLTSGGENIHGVSSIRTGSRYAIGMWFTTDITRKSYVDKKYDGDIDPAITEEEGPLHQTYKVST